MIRKKVLTEKKVIDLTGPDGNAFVLLGYAKSYAEQCEYNVEKIQEEMMAGDYENLVNVFDHYFGTFVILER